MMHDVMNKLATEHKKRYVVYFERVVTSGGYFEEVVAFKTH
jgi:hypothetical protein